MSLTLLQCCNVTVMQIKLTVLVVVLHGLALNNRKWTCTMRRRNHQRFHVIEFRRNIEGVRPSLFTKYRY